MNLGIIIITLVFLAIVTVPFVLTGYSKKRKNKHLFNKLVELAKNENCTISQHEFCSDFVIGLDEMANHLFFCKKVENLEIVKSVNLKNFKSCKVFNSNRTISNKSKKEKHYVVDKLELIFYPLKNETSEISLEIYNDEYDSLTLTGELELIQKWEKLLNERFKELNNPKAATGSRSATSVSGKSKSRKSVAA